MFKLLFSPYGSIKRLQFALGSIILLPLFLATMMIIWALICYIANIGINSIVNNIQQMVATHKQIAPVTLPVILSLAYGFLALAAATWSNFCLMLKRIVDLSLNPWLVSIPFICGHIAFYSVNPLLKTITNLIYLGCILIFIFYPSRPTE